MGGERLPEGERDRPAGYVYLIGVVEGCHKIGRSKDPDARLKGLDVSPVRLTVRHRIATTQAAWLETYLHTAFRHCRRRREWFHLDAECVELIRSISSADSVSALPTVVTAYHEANLDAARRGSRYPRLPQSEKMKKVAAGLAANLRAERARARLSLRAAAGRTGLSVHSLARCEQPSGRLPSIEALYSLAVLYQVEPTDLLTPPANVSLVAKRGKRK